MRILEIFPGVYSNGFFDEKLDSEISHCDKRGVLEAVAWQKTTIETFLFEILKLLKGIAIALNAPEIKEPTEKKPTQHIKYHYNKEDLY